MTNLTGKDFVRAIEGLLSKQSSDAQETKQVLTIRLISEFARQNGVPLQTGAVTTITRCLRKLDESSIRQVRSLSDMLLNKPEKDLIQDLETLRGKFMPIEARVHQIKTRSAFVTAALRPFSQRYKKSMFEDRTDLDMDQISKTVESLTATEIADLEGFSTWAKRVADLFDSLVIYRGADSDDFYTRPAGTVTERSSRTYLQAWLSFTEKFKSEIWSIAQSGELDENYEFKLSRAEDLTAENRRSALRNEKILPSAPSHIERTGTQTHQPTDNLSLVSANSSRTISESPAVRISVHIFSKIDPAAEAARNWETQQDFESTVRKWIDGVSVVWGRASEEMTAKVSVGETQSESSISLPAFTASDAAEKLILAVKFQIN